MNRVQAKFNFLLQLPNNFVTDFLLGVSRGELAAVLWAGLTMSYVLKAQVLTNITVGCSNKRPCHTISMQHARLLHTSCKSIDLTLLETGATETHLATARQWPSNIERDQETMEIGPKVTNLQPKANEPPYGVKTEGGKSCWTCPFDQFDTAKFQSDLHQFSPLDHSEIFGIIS